jgi:hypothetical protein
VISFPEQICSLCEALAMDIPVFLFHTIQPESIRNALKEAMTSQAAVDAVRDDIEDIANHVCDMHPEQEVRDAAGRLFPHPREEGVLRISTCSYCS